jgi:hypothetical protein
MLFVKGIADVLQEDLNQDAVLVFSRVLVVAELIRRQPQLGFKAKVCVVSVSKRGGPRQRRQNSSCAGCVGCAEALRDKRFSSSASVLRPRDRPRKPILLN